jgi:hypothetical protein
VASQSLHANTRRACLSLVALVAALVFVALPAASASADWRSAPVIPTIDKGISKPALKRLSSDQSRANVFAKAGDSISTAETFLQGFGCGPLDLGRYPGLKGTVDFFRDRRLPPGNPAPDGWPSEISEPICSQENSFSRLSNATKSGMTSFWPMEEPSVLRQELDQTRPGWVLVMFGTNDARDGHTNEQYQAAMDAIITESKAHGATPILYTLPPRLDDPALNQRIEEYNRVLFRLSRARHLPLINFWRALHKPAIVNHGLVVDGIHLGAVDIAYDTLGFVLGDLSTWVTAHNAAELNARALAYGANIRNLITLQTLKRVMAVVRAR